MRVLGISLLLLAAAPHSCSSRAAREPRNGGGSMLQKSQHTSMEERHLGHAPGAANLESTLISQIFVMCVVMYGGIALLWGVNMQRGSPEYAKIALLCVSWASTSVGMHVLNKALVDYLQAPVIITAMQMGLTVLVVSGRSWSELKGAPSAQILRWMIVPIFFSGMLISAFYAYSKISLTLLTLVRNLTPLMMLPLEALVMAPENRPAITFPVVAGMLTMLAGALVYSGGNFASISMVGVAFAFLNMILAVTDRLIQRRLLTTECKELSSTTCTLLNNFFGMLPTLALATATGQISEAFAPGHRARWMEPQVLTLLLVSGLVGTGISILGLECQRAISATSFSVMQNVSKVAVVSAGVVFFSDPMGSTTSVLGLMLSLGGSFLYAWAQQNAAKAKAAALPESCTSAEASKNGGILSKDLVKVM